MNGDLRLLAYPLPHPCCTDGTVCGYIGMEPCPIAGNRCQVAEGVVE